MTLEPIALLRSCFGEKFAVPRQPGLCPDAWGTLEWLPEFRCPDMVRGLEGFSHLWLIFGFHQTAGQGWHPTVRPPRLGGNQRVGVFASRSTFRPNPLGLSLVRLERIEQSPAHGPVLHLGGVDLVDMTPVYDIKPYLPYAECIPDASHGYAPAPAAPLEVVVAADVLPMFTALPARAQRVIRRCLELDPRPATQTGGGKTSFGAVLCGCNVEFRVDAPTCIITRLTPLPDGRLMG